MGSLATIHRLNTMLAKRIIPCLDVTGGRVVKGVNFVELRDAGDPVEIAARYNEQGADELTFLDITATSDGRDLILHIIEAVASQVFIPLTVGGGVRSVEDVRRLLNAGADKTSFNSAAIANPQVIRDASQKYGAQCIVVAIDAKRRQGAYEAARGPGSKNVPRWVAMHLCQEVGGVTLQVIADHFGLQRYGTVSTTIGKLRDELPANPRLQSQLHKLLQQLSWR